MSTVQGALCSGPPGPRGGFVVSADNHLSGFGDGAPDGGAVTVRCHEPAALLRGALGGDASARAPPPRVDLFVLDCEGCEEDVLRALVAANATGPPASPPAATSPAPPAATSPAPPAAPPPAVEVDVFVVEGNAARAAAALLAPTHFLATCLAMDLVFVRRNSAPAARWRWTRGDKAAAAAAAPDAAAALDARCPQFAAELRPLARALDEVAPARAR